MGIVRQLAALAIGLLAACVAADRQPDWQWRAGRATHYGGPNDGWYIHEGSCQYYYLDKTIATGWDIAAVSDHNWDFDGGSCGRCYEVACDDATIHDGYGNKLDRNSVCYDTSATVVVQITDQCPCYYPANAYSNKRWCCGDMYHLDMSVYAFEKLADKKWGVIPIKYRQVPCDYTQNKPAQPVSNPTAPERSPPSGWSPSQDKRPRFWANGQLVQLLRSTTQGVSAAVSSYANTVAGIINGASSSSPTSSGSSGALFIYNSGTQQGWHDTSYSSAYWTSGVHKSPEGGSSYCTTVSAGGSVAFQGWQGAFSGKKTVSLVTQKVNNGIPNFSIVLTGSQGVCRDVNLPAVTWQQGTSAGDWVVMTVPLNAFSWSSPDWTGSPQGFKGCGTGSLGDSAITGVQIKNNAGSDQWICIDKLQLA